MRRLIVFVVLVLALPLLPASQAVADHGVDSALAAGVMEVGREGECYPDGSGSVSGGGLGLPIVSGFPDAFWRLHTQVVSPLHGIGVLRICGRMAPDPIGLGASCHTSRGHSGTGTVSFSDGSGYVVDNFGWPFTAGSAIPVSGTFVTPAEIAPLAGVMDMEGGFPCFTSDAQGNGGATVFNVLLAYQLLGSTLGGGPSGNQSPPAPALISPAQGQALPDSGPHTFTMRATDPDGDDYYAVATIRSLTGGTVATITTGTVASGMNATGSATLAAGTYRWTARACDTGSGTCSGDNSVETVFSVGSSAPGNQPPGTPTQISPALGHVFGASATQSYTMQATDPEGSQYVGLVEVSDLNGNVVAMYFSGPTSSGAHSTASGSPRLAGGTYTWRASACDTQGACGPWSGSRAFSVAGTNSTVLSDDCTDTLVDGWFGSAYLRVGTGPGGPRTSWLCVRADHGTEVNGGGRLEVTSFDPLGTVTVTPTGGCTPPAGSQIAGSSVGDPSDPATYFAYSVHRWQLSGTERACVRVQQGAADLVSSGFLFNAAGGGQPDVDFQADGAGNHAEPEQPPPGTFASSLCQQATSGKVRIVNAEVEGARVWAYGHTAGTTTHLCVRGQQGSTGNGGRFTVAGGTLGAPPIAVQPGAPAPDDTSSPCGFSVFTHNPPPVVVRRSAPTADPVAVCAGLSGVNVWAFVDPTPGGTPPSATWTAD